MTDQEKALKTLLKADLLGGRIGIAQESALKVLRRDITNGDEWVAQLVTEVTTRTGVESTEGSEMVSQDVHMKWETGILSLSV